MTGDIFLIFAASRMESNGFPMCIHVSSATQKLLEDVGEWQYFGCREIKGAPQDAQTHFVSLSCWILPVPYF